MKRLEVMLVLGLVAMAGCSQFQARGVIATDIDAKVATAPAIISQVQAGTLSQADAQSLLAANATTMQSWADTKTTNILAYWFTAKLIFVNQDYSDDLDKAAVRFSAATRQAASQPADASYWVGREEQDFIKFGAAKAGTKSP